MPECQKIRSMVPYTKQNADSIAKEFFYMQYFMEKYGAILKKRGKSYFALCRFHNEKSPSMSTSFLSGQWKYKCFGCGRSGNVFNLIMYKEGVDFFEAYKIAAELKNPSGGGSAGTPNPNQTAMF